MSKVAVILMVTLIVGSALVIFSPVSVAGASPSQKLGFGNSGTNPDTWMALGYTCQSYYNAIMNTPPYPSALMWQLGVTKQWEGSLSQNFLDCLGNQLTSNQYMILLFGLNTGVGCCTYDPNALKAFESYASHLASQSFKSQLLVGLDGEHSQGMSQSDFNSMLSYIQSLGLRNANRYLGGQHKPFLTPVNVLDNTPYPFAGDRSYSIAANDPASLGVDVGVNGGTPYPSTDCGPGYGSGTGYPGWTNSPLKQGYQGTTPGSVPCAQDWPYAGATVGTLQDAFAANAGQPHSEFVLVNNGFLCSTGWYVGGAGNLCGKFTGVSGLQTNFYIDNPTFRNIIWQWIQTHPGYYLLGNGGSPSPQAPTTTRTSPLTSTTASPIVSTTIASVPDINAVTVTMFSQVTITTTVTAAPATTTISHVSSTTVTVTTAATATSTTSNNRGNNVDNGHGFPSIFIPLMLFDLAGLVGLIGLGGIRISFPSFERGRRRHQLDAKVTQTGRTLHRWIPYRSFGRRLLEFRNRLKTKARSSIRRLRLFF